MLSSSLENNIGIGTVVVVNYKDDNNKIFSEEAVLVDRYIIEKMYPKIEDGSYCCEFKKEEIFIFETPKTKRFVLTQKEFINYEKNTLKKYSQMNYQRLDVGMRVKLIANIYGVQNMKDVKFGTFGTITGIYQNPGKIKMASIIVENSKNKKSEIYVPLVNCIAIGEKKKS